MRTHTATNKTTAYGFRCGYIERIGRFKIEWEHCCYHIKGFSKLGDRLWQTATRLSDARKIAKLLNMET